MDLFAGDPNGGGAGRKPSQEYVIVETRTDRYDPLVSRISLTGVVAAGLVTPK